MLSNIFLWFRNKHLMALSGELKNPNPKRQTSTHYALNSAQRLIQESQSMNVRTPRLVRFPRSHRIK